MIDSDIDIYLLP